MGILSIRQTQDSVRGGIQSTIEAGFMLGLQLPVLVFFLLSIILGQVTIQTEWLSGGMSGKNFFSQIRPFVRWHSVFLEVSAQLLPFSETNAPASFPVSLASPMALLHSWRVGETGCWEVHGLTDILWFEFGQKQTLKQGFEGKWFIWEVISGNPGREMRKWDREEKKVSSVLSKPVNASKLCITNLGN